MLKQLLYIPLARVLSARLWKKYGPQSWQDAGITEFNWSFQYHDSDLIFISSDGVKFRIHRSKLETASEVFKGMFEANILEDDKVEFTDTKLETAEILELFLDLVYDKNLPCPRDPKRFLKIYERLIDFLIKYEAINPIHLFSEYLKTWIKKGVIPSSRFLIMGAQLYRPDVVAAAMRSTHANDTEESQAADVESVHLCQRYQALSGYSELDLGAMSLEDFRRIPDDFKFALLQAEKEVRNETYFYSWQLVADKFENIMRDFLLPERAV